jgi:hypothetical protein
MGIGPRTTCTHPAAAATDANTPDSIEASLEGTPSLGFL